MAKTPEKRILLLEPHAALDDLLPNPRNPRRHPAKQLEQLAASINRFGQPRPILARMANRMIVGGHGLALAMRRAGATHAQVLLWDVDQQTADAFMVADNQHGLNGRDDDAQLALLLEELARDDFASLGFDAEAANKLLEQGGEIEVRAVDTTPVKDRFWISVRGPLKSQAKALKQLQAVMKEVPDVSVELGTVAGE